MAMMARAEGIGNVLKLAGFLSEPREVTEVVKELCELDRKTGLELALAIGRVVLTRFFGDSPEAWHERRKNKNNSVRRIVEHPDCPLSRTALNDAIAVYVVVQALPCVRASGHINASHIAAVAFLGVHKQRHWLERAEQEKWSTRELKEQIRAQRHESGERRGRPRVTAQHRLISGLRSAVVALRRNIDALSALELDANDTRELTALADQVAVLQATMCRAKGATLSGPRAGPSGIAKVETEPERETARENGLDAPRLVG